MAVEDVEPKFELRPPASPGPAPLGERVAAAVAVILIASVAVIILAVVAAA